MTTSVKSALWLFSATLFFACSGNKQQITLPAVKSVEIELSIPHGDHGKTLLIGCNIEPISVIFHNYTDSAVRMYEDWNSWGYYNISFEIVTNDSTYIVRKKQRTWWKNYPSYNVIDPGEALIFNFNMDDSSCLPRRIIRGHYEGWTGLPQKDYDSAKIKVLFQLTDDISLQMYDEPVRRSFLAKLSSKQYDVAIAAVGSALREINNVDTSGINKTPE